MGGVDSIVQLQRVVVGIAGAFAKNDIAVAGVRPIKIGDVTPGDYASTVRIVEAKRVDLAFISLVIVAVAYVLSATTEWSDNWCWMPKFHCAEVGGW